MANAAAQSGILNDRHHLFSPSRVPGAPSISDRIKLGVIPLDEGSFSSFSFIFSISPLDIVSWVPLGNEELHEIREEPTENSPRL